MILFLGRSVAKSTDSQLTGSSSVGCTTLMSLLTNYCRNKDVKTAIRVGVVGYPNVGKSSVINSLKRSKACSTGNTPGVTRCVQEIQLDKKIKLLDSPGLVLSRSTDDPLKNVIRVENIDDPIAPVERILQRCDTAYMRQKYDLPVAYKDTTQFLHLLALTTGRLKKGGVPDLVSAARTVINDWNSGNIRYYTHPPEAAAAATEGEAASNKETGEKSAIVTEFSREFDLDNLDDQMDMETLKEAEDEEMDAVSMASSKVKKETAATRKFGVDRKAAANKKAEDFSMAAVGSGKKSLKKLKRLQSKKDRKERNRSDRVATDLSDKLEKVFEEF
jgi:nuclear GTP-binding protein